jgi:hypothetical protein
VAPVQRDEDHPIDAVDVVTEDQLKDEEKQKNRKLLSCGFGALVSLLIVIVVPVALPRNDDDAFAIVNITDSPTGAPSSSPTTSVFADLMLSIEQLYGEENDALFSESIASQLIVDFFYDK